jgi:hypothetical protein
MDEAREMARDAMEGYISVLVEDGVEVPESDPPEIVPRYDQLAQTLREQNAPTLEQITTAFATAA